MPWFWGKSSADRGVSVALSRLTLSMDWSHPGLPGPLALLPQTRESGFFLPLCPETLKGSQNWVELYPIFLWMDDFLTKFSCLAGSVIPILWIPGLEDVKKLFKKNHWCLVAPADLALIDWLSKPLWKLQTASWKNGPQSFQGTKVVFLIFSFPLPLMLSEADSILKVKQWYLFFWIFILFFF